jgi:hypothetical protein
VQVRAQGTAGIVIRDSKQLNGPSLKYSREEFADFVKGIKAGEFDDFC